MAAELAVKCHTDKASQVGRDNRKDLKMRERSNSLEHPFLYARRESKIQRLPNGTYYHDFQLPRDPCELRMPDLATVNANQYAICSSHNRYRKAVNDSTGLPIRGGYFTTTKILSFFPKVGFGGEATCYARKKY